MRKVSALLACLALAVAGTSGAAFASHKSKSPHANPPDCSIEVDPLGICLDL